MTAYPDSSSLADHTIIDRIRAGDRVTFDAWYVANREPLEIFAYYYLKSRDLAEEIVQDVFVSIWLGRHHWNVRGSLRAYLYGAVRNEAWNYLRHQRVIERTNVWATGSHATPGMSTPTPLPDEQVVDADDRARLTIAVQRLPPRQREALILRWHEDLSAAEIARIMGIADSVARKLLVKALRNLRAMWDEQTPEV
jgi:RNA polymerase sigma-70 factor (ECF subfamily)